MVQSFQQKIEAYANRGSTTVKKGHPGLQVNDGVLTIEFDFTGSSLIEAKTTVDAIQSQVHTYSEQTWALKIHLIFSRNDGPRQGALRDWRINVVKGVFEVINKRFYKPESVAVVVTMPVYNFTQLSTVVGCYYTNYRHWTLAYRVGREGDIVPVEIQGELETMIHRIYLQHRETGTAIKPQVRPQAKKAGMHNSGLTITAGSVADNSAAEAKKFSNNSSALTATIKAQNVAIQRAAAAQSVGQIAKSTSVVDTIPIAELNLIDGKGDSQTTGKGTA